MTQGAGDGIGLDPEESADSATASEGDGTAAANGTSDGALLSETVYYADGTRGGARYLRPSTGRPANSSLTSWWTGLPRLPISTRASPPASSAQPAYWI